MQYKDLQIEVPEEQRVVLKKMLEKGYQPCIMTGEIPIYDAHLGKDGEPCFTWHIHDTEVSDAK